MSNLMTSNDLEQLAEHAQEAAALLKQLSNQHRLMILCSLIDSELSVTELNSRTNLSQSALSQHLASLRNAGLVQTRREAQTIF
ncbi:MAG: metalloregulator ArsR/SmtB family transcription factor, partial [Porticoccaceae bacterium]|nr:metalloregulator ArsR/SmtB family transcription factor [Porticoccaceae bacterium]